MKIAWPRERLDELLNNTGIDPSRRAQTLSMQEWRVLTEQYIRLK